VNLFLRERDGNLEVWLPCPSFVFVILILLYAGNVSMFASILKKARETPGLIDLGQVTSLDIEFLVFYLQANDASLVWNRRDFRISLVMTWLESKRHMSSKTTRCTISIRRLSGCRGYEARSRITIALCTTQITAKMKRFMTLENYPRKLSWDADSSEKRKSVVE